jgi:hypothetical protein
VIANSSSSQSVIYFKRCLRSHVWVAAGQELVAAITGVMPIASYSGPTANSVASFLKTHQICLYDRKGLAQRYTTV